ncbi:Mur ligase domain-containing protein [Dongshaea marina]|uniref:Mur ligase domain-containing protein n=1 Tax=Dongshaea marina TaxID=2047966 RepID=UPI001F357C86|nr:Mur ligase domain-containing protein [Dongshaea marina]
MIPLNLQQIAQVLNATLVGDSCTLASVSIDTRTLGPGALYVALRGERFDGHQFCDKAREQGRLPCWFRSARMLLYLN